MLLLLEHLDVQLPCVFIMTAVVMMMKKCASQKEGVMRYCSKH